MANYIDFANNNDSPGRSVLPQNEESLKDTPLLLRPPVVKLVSTGPHVPLTSLTISLSSTDL